MGHNVSKNSVSTTNQTKGRKTTATAQGALRMRLSLNELERPENAQKKNDFLKAWKIIKELPVDNPNSFWSIASYHGMPYKKRRVPPYTIPPNDDNNSAWDGYCQHANILFPTWHRFYCLRLEQALQTAVPDGDVALHYWDETDEDNMANGMPQILWAYDVVIDGQTVPNPLATFQLPLAIDVPPVVDNPDSYAQYYAKPEGYYTQRYPMSGISNPPASKAIADKHNLDMMHESGDAPSVLLKQNLIHWFTAGMTPPSARAPNSIYYEFKHSLDQTSYNRFSNTSSAVTTDCLEQAHNEVHLAVGGFTDPKALADGSANPKYYGLLQGANGDMGENENAAFDPIFFLHHCNIDRMFWIWQKKHHYEDSIPLDTSDPNDTGLTPISQGPTPNQEPGQSLNFDTILYPFQDAYGVPRTSKDCFDIRLLGYDYSIGSLDQPTWPAAPLKHDFVELSADSWDDLEKKVEETARKDNQSLKITFESTFLPPPPLSFLQLDSGLASEPDPSRYVQLGRDRFELRFNLNVRNLNKNAYPGSFVVQAFYEKENGELEVIGQRGILDRWDRSTCKNCQKHNRVSVGFAVDKIISHVHDLGPVQIQVVHKDPKTGTAVTIPVKNPGEEYNQERLGAAKEKDEPTVHITATFTQDLLGPQ